MKKPSPGNASGGSLKLQRSYYVLTTLANPGRDEERVPPTTAFTEIGPDCCQLIGRLYPPELIAIPDQSKGCASIAQLCVQTKGMGDEVVSHKQGLKFGGSTLASSLVNDSMEAILKIGIYGSKREHCRKAAR